MSPQDSMIWTGFILVFAGGIFYITSDGRGRDEATWRALFFLSMGSFVAACWL